MAKNDLFDTGIKVTGSFSAAGAFPVDSKFIVETIAERDDHVTQHRSYVGMLVYVKETGITYQLKDTGWEEFGFNADKFKGSVYDGLDSESVALALAAKQGKLLNDKITTHTADTDVHITTEERQAWNAKAETTEASQEAKGLMSAADKAKLDAIAEGANKYVHPNTHAATMITEDETHKFVTDEQIAAWSAKAETKEDVGLGNVTNDAQVKRTEMGVAGGVATLDESGLVHSTQLPSYVDDVLEAATKDELPEDGETGKIYVTLDSNLTYRWSGTQYVEISQSLALGETESTAYSGKKGKDTTDAVNKILDGTTVIPSATNAETVNNLTVETAVPVNAKFTDTTYVAATQEDEGLMSADDKTKLDGIQAGANLYVHPDDETHRHVTDTQIAQWTAKAETTEASTNAAGLMSAADKAKLDAIAEGANKYEHPDDAEHRHVSDEQIAAWSAKAETTVASITANGLMSSTDKTKLDGIEEGANLYVHPNDENTRHVTDAQIAAWDAKAETTVATQEANGLMSTSDKTKLDNIEISKVENIKYTLTAAAFQDGEGKVTIPVDGITADSMLTIGLDYKDLTSRQYDAAGLAKFKTVIGDTGVELSCFGVMPTVDIPVALSIIK